MSDWIEHRRSDGELLGWLVPEGDGFHVVDLLSRRRTQTPVDWADAEERLEDLGIGYLAERTPGRWRFNRTRAHTVDHPPLHGLPPGQAPRTVCIQPNTG